MDNTVQTYKLTTLVGTGVSLTIKKTQINGYTNYNVSYLTRERERERQRGRERGREGGTHLHIHQCIYWYG